MGLGFLLAEDVEGGGSGDGASLLGDDGAGGGGCEGEGLCHADGCDECDEEILEHGDDGVWDDWLYCCCEEDVDCTDSLGRTNITPVNNSVLLSRVLQLQH